MSRRNELGRVGKGIAIAVLSGAFAATIYFSIALVLQQISPNTTASPSSPLAKTIYNTLTLLFWGIGFSQIIHILPIALWLKRRRETETLKGLIIGAAIVCFLCGGCFVVFSQVVTSYFLQR